ncbi:Probable protein phosphatase 2C 2 (AtPP2C02) (Protein phosphatase AP2C2) [Durusdinium trenchii]|uniref:Probable protein phosphatase 2C 2 (AtPP2C02) (Protein phosphatase AP2C2) n=1 Tax=Durusdinium trenchii TaxID=1381693 RepID=A0ABP0I248_9DINO
MPGPDHKKLVNSPTQAQHCGCVFCATTKKESDDEGVPRIASATAAFPPRNLGKAVKQDPKKHVVQKGPLEGCAHGDDQHGWCVMQNGRGAMEDAVDVQDNFFAVYDGHGGAEAVVTYVKEAFPKLLGKEKGPDMGLRMKEAFQKADAALLGHLQQDEADVPDYPLSSGVCACIAVRDEHELAVANLGDCRALAYKGGSLTVTIFSVDADTEFIFENMTNLDAVQSIRRQLRRNLGTRSPQAAAESLVNQAQKLKSTDNLSALVVVFRMPPAEASNSSLGRKVLLKGLDAYAKCKQIAQEWATRPATAMPGGCRDFVENLGRLTFQSLVRSLKMSHSTAWALMANLSCEGSLDG